MLNVRPVTPDDVPALRDILNEIINIGGTTAYQEPLTDDTFREHFLTGSHCLTCFICEDKDGQALGFQSLGTLERLPEQWGDIATFARVSNKVKGVGSVLFQSTQAFASDNSLIAINATIRADNCQGLSYYSKLGFVDYDIRKAVPLQDGTPVDRISKKYVMARA